MDVPVDMAMIPRKSVNSSHGELVDFVNEQGGIQAEEEPYVQVADLRV